MSPTASWSMDSDMICVISTDGKEFEVIDEMALGFESKWEFNKNLLGFIAGGGRIVFGFKNKDLKVKELPAYHSLDLTPKNYADMGFSWVNETSLIVSRVPETEWSNDSKMHPKASLYNIPLYGHEQVRITTPPKEEEDSTPQFLPIINKITWIRGNTLPHYKADLWVADPYGDNAKVWINNIGFYSFFPAK
ncbi:hypothetical protein [Psychrobacillus glaciei]|uniref:hypothetical protein n=1 Tax=Psychrobacillus glaciei TaxID=2283160 RepID=UPI001CEF92F5|nr:hypothetical protein [Psychrobacillus glaciei]